MSVAGRVVVVTGAGGGIGKAVVKALVDRDGTVCAIGRTLSRMETLCREQNRSSRVTIHAADFRLEEDVRRVCADCLAAHPRVDALIHCAGVFDLQRLDRAPLEELDRQYRVNVRAPLQITQFLLPSLKSCRGDIVFVNSSAGLAARADIGHYSASKHALRAIADSLRAEVNAEGVRVLSIYPGRTASAMQEHAFSLEGRRYTPESLLQPEDVASVIVHALELPPTAEVTEISIRPRVKA